MDELIDEIIQELKGPKDRKSHSVYVSERVMREFKKACGNELSASKVLEAFMKKFVAKKKLPPSR